MPSIKKVMNQRGMTLVELLAAITILGVVFIGFVSIFPQMTQSNLQTEGKLETINLARQELVKLKDGMYTFSDKAPGTDELLYNSIKNGDTITYVKEDDGFQYEIEYWKTPDLNKKTGIKKSVQLNKIHIEVKKEEKVISETFGYLKE